MKYDIKVSPEQQERLRKSLMKDVAALREFADRLKKERDYLNGLSIEGQYAYFRGKNRTRRGKSAEEFYQQLEQHFYKPVVVYDKELMGLGLLLGQGLNLVSENGKVGFEHPYRKEWRPEPIRH